MIINKLSNLSVFRLSSPEGYINNIDNDVRNLFLFTQGRVRFGSGTDGAFGENISGQFQVITDTGTADTQFTVAHGIGAVPVGFIVININKGGVVYDSGTTWTSSNIYLKCTTANTQVSIFILK